MFYGTNAKSRWDEADQRAKKTLAKRVRLRQPTVKISEKPKWFAAYRLKDESAESLAEAANFILDNAKGVTQVDTEMYPYDNGVGFVVWPKVPAINKHIIFAHGGDWLFVDEGNRIRVMRNAELQQYWNIEEG